MHPNDIKFSAILPLTGREEADKLKLDFAHFGAVDWGARGEAHNTLCTVKVTDEAATFSSRGGHFPMRVAHFVYEFLRAFPLTERYFHLHYNVETRVRGGYAYRSGDILVTHRGIEHREDGPAWVHNLLRVTRSVEQAKTELACEKVPNYKTQLTRRVSNGG